MLRDEDPRLLFLSIATSMSDIDSLMMDNLVDSGAAQPVVVNRKKTGEPIEGTSSAELLVVTDF